MASKNSASIIGRLGNDPEIKIFDNGGKIANFTVATSEKWKDKTTGELKENTEWHRVTANGKLVDVIEKWVKKGHLISIDGKLRTRSWEKDGTTMYTTEIVVRDMVMLSSGGSGEGNSAPHTGTPNQNNQPDVDLPF